MIKSSKVVSRPSIDSINPTNSCASLETPTNTSKFLEFRLWSLKL